MISDKIFLFDRTGSVRRTSQYRKRNGRCQFPKILAAFGPEILAGFKEGQRCRAKVPPESRNENPHPANEPLGHAQAKVAERCGVSVRQVRRVEIELLVEDADDTPGWFSVANYRRNWRPHRLCRALDRAIPTSKPSAKTSRLCERSLLISRFRGRIVRSCAKSKVQPRRLLLHG